MCLCMRVFWTVLQNLTVRIIDDALDSYYKGCCKKNQQETQNEVNQNIEEYVIMNDGSSDHKQLLTKNIEDENYFRTIDRITAEEILRNRVDGSCLVRPYREMDTCVKYIISVYARHNFFHLYVRKISGLDKYGFGLEKPLERLFNSPNDIINYYRLNKILCTNKIISVSLVLVPIA